METQTPAANRPPGARPSRWRTLLMFFSVIGPGIITANADNDVGGIQTYSLAGAQFGYSMLWLLIPVTLALIVTQEMCARMGAVTGKGLADLIRENFGVRVTFVVLLLFVLSDLGNTAAEFAGVAYASPVFQSYVPFLNKYVLVIGAAVFVFTMVTRGNYKIVEKIFFAFCTVYLAYVVSGFLVHPPWHEVLAQTFLPHFKPTQAYLLTAIGVIGTTISPWMQFYIQSAIVEKGVRTKDYAFSRIDVISGAIITDVVAYFIIVSCAATIFVANQHLAPGAHPLDVQNAGDIATALAPLAGKYAALLFALGLLNAAIFTASILPLSTAYYVCEAFGFESGVQNRLREAPVF
jgi:NRAMP (natural resistance-associated macrophage protein)-like metal ion transporter